MKFELTAAGSTIGIWALKCTKGIISVSKALGAYEAVLYFLNAFVRWMNFMLKGTVLKVFISFKASIEGIG